MSRQVIYIRQGRREGPSSYSPVKCLLVLISVPERMSIHTTDVLPQSVMRTSQTA